MLNQILIKMSAVLLLTGVSVASLDAAKTPETAVTKKAVKSLKKVKANPSAEAEAPIQTVELSTTETVTLAALEKRLEDENLPKWLTPTQKKELKEMAPVEQEKAILQWSEEFIKGREQLTKQDEGVKRLLAKSRLNKDVVTTGVKSAKPIFSQKEQERFEKMTDQEREDFLRKKGIRVKIDREKTSETLQRLAEEGSTSVTMEFDLNLKTGEATPVEPAQMVTVKDKSTTMTVRVKKK